MSHDPTAPSADQFALSGAWNFRDVAGLRTSDGRVVRPGIVHRSSALTHLDDAGRRTLERLGVEHVFDLRGLAEADEHGADRTPTGVTVHAVPYYERIVRDEDAAAPHETTAARTGETARNYLLDAYDRFPSLPGARVAITSVVTTLVDTSTPILVHCAAGKDRAGWTIATVLMLIGVTEEDVLADYLRSNDAIAPLREHLRLEGVTHDVPEQLLGVRPEYLRAGRDAMIREHGSLDGYREWLGLAPGTVRALRDVVLA